MEIIRVFIGIYILLLWISIIQIWPVFVKYRDSVLENAEIIEYKIKAEVPCFCILLTRLGFPLIFGFAFVDPDELLVLPIDFILIGGFIIIRRMLIIVRCLRSLFVLYSVAVRARSYSEKLTPAEVGWWMFIRAAPCLLTSLVISGAFFYFGVFGF